MVVMFFGGTLACMLCTWLKMKRLVGLKVLVSCLTFSATSFVEPVVRICWVLQPPPQKQIWLPNCLTRSCGFMFLAEIWTGLRISKPASMMSGMRGLIEPQQCRKTFMSLFLCTKSQNFL